MDLTKSGEYLDEFPAYVLKFMTSLETLRLDGTNISCFPPRDRFSELRALRKLNLSGTSIDYLPPSVLFGHPQIMDVDLSETPVSQYLDWSDHSLGLMGLGLSPQKDRPFTWNRLAETLPMLTSLNLSGNNLTENVALNLNLSAYRSKGV